MEKRKLKRLIRIPSVFVITKRSQKAEKEKNEEFNSFATAWPVHWQ